jgi:3-methyladenine DNA glycosylase AlkD
MNTIKEIQLLLHQSVTIPKERAATFFKTGTGNYAEHDQFIGVKVPTIRLIAKKFSAITLDEIQLLIESSINEERLLALCILTDQYKKADIKTKEQLYQFYLNNLSHVSNWNLVDASAHLIIGAHLFKKDKKLLYSLAQSTIMWERRIAIVATYYFIRNNELEWTFKIASLLLNDTHDLIHKAVGWMLREAGKRNQDALVIFLGQHAYHMPRTMLRYAIEKFDENIRKKYLAQKNKI